MQISSRFTIALHIFACISVAEEHQKVTSDFLAGSINTNPVLVRKIMSQLRQAGLITVARGTGGATLAKNAEEISFYDVYKAVDSVKKDSLFRFHEKPNPACPVGRNIHAVLDNTLEVIQSKMEEELRRHTIADVEASLKALLSEAL